MFESCLGSHFDGRFCESGTARYFSDFGVRGWGRFPDLRQAHGLPEDTVTEPTPVRPVFIPRSPSAVVRPRRALEALFATPKRGRYTGLGDVTVLHGFSFAGTRSGMHGARLEVNGRR